MPYPFNIRLLFMVVVCFLFIDKVQASGPTEITSTFDHGSLGPVRIIADTLIKGQTMHWIKQDKIGNQYYWFYFKLLNVKDKTIRFEFDNMTGVYRGNLQEKFGEHTRPVYSYDHHDWSRIKNTAYDKNKKQYRFTHSFEKTNVWIAYAHPYPLKRHHDYIKNLAADESIALEKIGTSVLGHDITLVTLPRHEHSARNGKNVLVLACQHAGEDCGGFFIEGLIEELSADSGRVREKTSFYIVPMMNPDGYFYGTSRYNYNMQDLNAEWDDDVGDSLNLPVEPEVKAVKNWYQKFKQTAHIDLVVDVHSHGQDPRKCTLHSEDKNMSVLVKEINRYWPAFFVFKKSRGNCRGYFVMTEKVPACTLELSQSDLNDGRPYLNIADYKKHGGQLVSAIHKFLDKM